MTGTWPSGWATGDLTLAAQYAKGIGCIFDSTLGAPAANVDVTSIVGTYAHLLIVAYARNTSAVVTTNLTVNFNGDTAANYDRQQLSGSAAATAGSEGFATNFPALAIIPGASAGANLFGAAVIFIPHYAGSSNNKVALAASSAKSGTTSGSITGNLSGVFWRSSAAITRVTLLPPAGNFAADTRVSIYGMGA